MPQNSVYGSIANFYGSLTQGPMVYGDMAICPKEYYKSILMSNKLYWKKALDIGPLASMSQELVDQRKDDMFVGNRDIPYKRDPKTDPESYAPEAENPFSVEHPPRIYVSLGTRANDKPQIFKGIMAVLGG